MAKRKRGRTPVLDMGPRGARKFLLKGGSYCRFGLPKYLVFDALLRGGQQLPGEVPLEVRVQQAQGTLGREPHDP